MGDSETFLTSFLARLRTMPEYMVHQYQRQHGFHHRRGPNAYTGIMPSLGDYFDFITINIQTAARQP